MTADTSISRTSDPALSELERGGAMDRAWVRKRVMALFEKHRAVPGAPCDEQCFMDFLLARSTERRTVFEGFRAARRLNAFIDDVQYEFAICFSPSDRRANDSLQEFIERLIRLDGSRSRSRRSWKNQLLAGTEWACALLANLVLLVAAVSLRNQEWALGALGCAALFVNAWFVRVAWRTSAYFRRLQWRIEVAERQLARPAVLARSPRTRLRRAVRAARR